jgi:hypothetical protein
MVTTSKRIGRAEHIAHMREKINVFRILVGRSEEKRLSERPRHRTQDNIKIKISESVD